MAGQGKRSLSLQNTFETAIILATSSPKEARMAQKIDAPNVTLRDLETQFALQLVRDTQFFPEWQTDLPYLTEMDK